MCTACVSFIIDSNEHNDSVNANGPHSWTVCRRSRTLFYPFSGTAGYQTVVLCTNDSAEIQSERNYFLCMSEWFVVKV
jgi:hypothetical protein